MEYIMNKKCTIFCDIDGTIIKYRNFTDYKTTKPLPINTIVEINYLYDNGHHIVLTTARPEYLRYHTLKELDELGVNFHKLVMGIGRGIRILINDNDPNKQYNRAYAFNLERDIGFTSKDIEKLNKISKLL